MVNKNTLTRMRDVVLKGRTFILERLVVKSRRGGVPFLFAKLTRSTLGWSALPSKKTER